MASFQNSASPAFGLLACWRAPNCLLVTFSTGAYYIDHLLQPRDTITGWFDTRTVSSPPLEVSYVRPRHNSLKTGLRVPGTFIGVGVCHGLHVDSGKHRRELVGCDENRRKQEKFSSFPKERKMRSPLPASISLSDPSPYRSPALSRSGVRGLT